MKIYMFFRSFMDTLSEKSVNRLYRLVKYANMIVPNHIQMAISDCHSEWVAKKLNDSETFTV